MPDIEISGLRFSYEDAKESMEALHGVDISIEDGEFVCIIGPSGCGKSTLLRLLAGLEKPGQGGICIDGREISGPGSDRMIVFQDYSLFPWLRAEGNVSFAVRQARKVGKKEAAELAQRWLDKMGMGEYARLYPFQLSGGMKQRVAIARALAMDTEILLLDEPFGALDAKIRTELQQLLEELCSQGEKKKTVVFVTHDIEEAVLLADRVIVMGRGKVCAGMRIELPRPRAAESREVREGSRQLRELLDRAAEGQGEE